jgi:flagellar hook assembly protein FlgD
MVEIIAHDQSTDTSNSSPVNRVTQIKVLAAWANYQTNTTQSFAWDGTDNFGAIVQPGTYFVRVSTRFSTSDTQPGQMNYGSTIFTVTD